MLPDDDGLEPEQDESVEAADDEAEAAAEQPDDDDKPLPGSRRRDRDARRWNKLTRALADKDRELGELRARVEKADRDRFSADAIDLEKQIKGLREKLKNARESGDTDAEDDIEEELTRLRFRHESARALMANDQSRQQQEQTAAAAEANRRIPLDAEEQRAFNQRTAAWVDDSGFRSWDPEEQRVLLAIETMVAGKHKAGTDAYFRTMAQRLKNAMPDRSQEVDYATRRLVRGKPRPTFDDDDDTTGVIEPPASGVRRASVPPAGNDAASGSGAPVRLSREHVKLMERWHLDPANPVHRAEFASNMRRHGLA